MITEQAHADKILAVRDAVEGVEEVVLVDGEPPAGTISLDQLAASGDGGFDFEAAWRAVQPDDVLTLIYTSGTTGPPKGVQITHANICETVRSYDELIQFPDGGRIVSYLPMAHVAERNVSHYLPMLCGFTITCCPDAREVMEYLPEVRPTWFFAVPRIWEKLKAGLEQTLAAAPEKERAATAGGARRRRSRRFGWSSGARRCRTSSRRGWPRRTSRSSRSSASGLGLDQVEACNVGAAPTPPEVIEFFHALGIPLSELWGMSETTGAGTCNPPERIKIGTIGPPAPGVEIKLAEDGEIMIKGPVVMKGYRNLPEKTAEAFTDDGFLLTGDIGEFDEDGYLRIVDRKKELIITAQGKNLSPANIEARLKQIPLVSQAVAIGDARKYISALLTLDAEAAQRLGAGARHRRRPGHAGRERGAGRGGAARRGRRQPGPGAGRAGEALRDPARRLGAGRRRADADHEAEAQADRREVRDARSRRSTTAERGARALRPSPGPRGTLWTMASKRQIWVKDVPIGGGAPIAVQTMTKTETANLAATMEQIREVAEAGSDLVRVAVPREVDVEALKTIVGESPIPVIADIHFNYTLALKAIDAGAHCIRLNPGNIGGPDKVAQVAEKATAAGVPMRIGVNSGSLPKHLHELERSNPVEALAQAAVEFVELMERLEFENFKVSIKSTSVPNTIAANRLLASKIEYPIHLGITEAGTKWSGSLKSAVGLGTLLADGVGDTIRISLSTFHAEEEVKVAWEILKALGLRERGPVLIACPTCGRLQFDMDTVVAEIERRLEQYTEPIEVAVLGCAVNGIGEASHADFGITGAKNEGLIFAHGKPLRKVPQAELVDALFEEIDKSLDRGRVDVDDSKAAEGAAWLQRIEDENADELTPERIAQMEAAGRQGGGQGHHRRAVPEAGPQARRAGRGGLAGLRPPLHSRVAGRIGH